MFDGRGGSASDTVTWTITPLKEVVVYTDCAWAHGAWQRVEDPTAAGGYRMVHPDAGAPKVNTPLAAERFLTTRPGSAKNDTVIIGRTYY